MSALENFSSTFTPFRRKTMTNRRNFLALSALTASLFPIQKVLAQAGESSTTAATGEADFLFVQTAKSMSYDPATQQLTLIDASPTTLFFSDRPERIAGNMTTERFIPFWSTGTDSFLSDPPNADLSILEDGTLTQVVVVLQDPTLEDGNLTYTVEIVDGEMPATGNNPSLFIDVIGMPLTPVSYAGVARRTYRRAVLY
jgi:hypothetical protein